MGRTYVDLTEQVTWPSWASGAVLLGAGSAQPTVVSPGANGNVLQSNGSAWASAAFSEAFYNIGTVTTAYTVSLANGTVQQCMLTGGSTCTFAFPAASGGKQFTLMIKQPATGTLGNILFPSASKWPNNYMPGSTQALGIMDTFGFVSDGTDWFATYAQGYVY